MYAVQIEKRIVELKNMLRELREFIAPEMFECVQVELDNALRELASPQGRLRYHVTGAIARGEGEPIVEQPLAVIAKKTGVTIRYGTDGRIRVFTAFKPTRDGKQDVRIAWGDLQKNGSLQTVAAFMRKYSAAETARVGTTHERWYYNLSTEALVRKFEQWRKSAQKAGLTQEVSFEEW